MDEKVLHLIFHVVGIVLGILLGYFIRKSREGGLGKDTTVCDDVARDINEVKQRTADITEDVGGLLEKGRDMEELFRKYSDQTSEDTNVE